MGEKWENDLQLSIHSYYKNEHKTGIRACERGLSVSTPWEIENNFRNNYSFYIPILSKIYNITNIRLEIPNKKPLENIFNPSIINYKDKTIVFIRSANYRIINGKYEIFDDRSVIRNKYYSAILDAYFSLNEIHEIFGPEYEKNEFPADGLEDIRPFLVGDDIFVSGTIRNKNPYTSKARIAISKFDYESHKMSGLDMLESPEGPDVHEKNWMPVIGNGFEWIYNCNSNGNTKIINQNSEITSHHAAIELWKGFRGGSQVIPYKDGYLCIIHEVSVKNDNTRCYTHRFVKFNNELKIIRYSIPFFLKKTHSIEFVSGICLSPSGVIVSFGIMDEEAWLASIDDDIIENLLSIREDLMNEDCSICYRQK